MFTEHFTFTFVEFYIGLTDIYLSNMNIKGNFICFTNALKVHCFFAGTLYVVQ